MEAKDFDATIPNYIFINYSRMKTKMITIDNGYTMLLQSDGVIVIVFRVQDYFFPVCDHTYQPLNNV